MNLSETTIKEIANQIDLKDVGFFIKENMSNYKIWLKAEKGESVIIILAEVKKYWDEKLNAWIYC